MIDHSFLERKCKCSGNGGCGICSPNIQGSAGGRGYISLESMMREFEECYQTDRPLSSTHISPDCKENIKRFITSHFTVFEKQIREEVVKGVRKWALHNEFRTRYPQERAEDYSRRKEGFLRGMEEISELSLPELTIKE